MNKYILLLALSVLFAVRSAPAQGNYIPDRTCCAITEMILDLKVVSARRQIEDQLLATPENYYLYYLDQFNDFVQLLVAANDERYDRLNNNYYAYRDIMDEHDTSSPYYLYILSDMQLQIALARLKFGHTLSGMTMGWKAYRNMKKNLEKHPDFYGNKKLRGLFNVLLGNIPPFLRSVAGLFGVKPGKVNTIDLLSAYKADISDKPGLSTEASLYITLSLLLDKKADEAYRYISNLEKQHYDVFLVNYFHGNIAYHNRQNEEALKIFREIDINSPEINFDPYYFIYGKILMNALDPQARNYLEIFVSKTNGKDYLKQAHLYLAYCFLFDGDKLKYESELLKVQAEGDNKTERDRDALLDLRRGYLPDTTLLKTSFLVKGSYFLRADSLLGTYTPFNDTFLPYRLEYHLLKGQVSNGLDNPAEAIPQLELVIREGSVEKYDFATRAALELAAIYEKLGDTGAAMEYYLLASDLYRSDYYESLEDLAQKGIQRSDHGAVTNE